MLGEEGRHAEDASALILADVFDFSPIFASDAGNPVTFGEGFIEEGVVCGEEIHDRAVVLDQVRAELNRLSIHRPSERSEFGEKAFVFVIVKVEVAQMEPLAGEFDGEPLDLVVAEHSPNLATQGGFASERVLFG